MVILSDDEFECNRTQLHFWVLLNKPKLLKIVDNEIVIKKFCSFQIELFTVESYLFIYFMVTMEDDNQNKWNYFYHDT